MKKSEEIKNKILTFKNEEKALHFMKFFKTGKGQYGEGDKFIGLSVPEQRQIAKEFYDEVAINDLQVLLESKYHEVRLTALLIMVIIYSKNVNKKEEVVELYLNNIKNI